MSSPFLELHGNSIPEDNVSGCGNSVLVMLQNEDVFGAQTPTSQGLFGVLDVNKTFIIACRALKMNVPVALSVVLGFPVSHATCLHG